MRKLAVIVLSIALMSALGVGLLGETDNPVVSWSMNEGGSCWITFTGHGDVDLGDATGGSETLSSTGNGLSIDNNCTSGITLTVEPNAVSDPYETTSDGSLPNEASVFDDFKWKASNAHAQFSIATGMDSYHPFDDLSDEDTVGSTSNPASVNVDIDYQYVTDLNDVPGSYSVTLLYTVSSN